MPHLQPLQALQGQPEIAQLAEVAGLGVLIQGLDDGLLWASPAALQRLGYASLEEMRRRWRPEDTAQLCSVVPGPGEDRPYRILLLTDGRAGLDEAGRWVEARQRMLERFLRVPIHDLRTPLNTIGVNAELLRRQTGQPAPEPQRTADCAAAISSEVARLDQGLRWLAERLRPPSTPAGALDLRDVVDGVAALAAPTAAHLGVKLRVERATEPMLVEGEHSLLELCLGEILHDSLEAAPMGGVIVLQTLLAEGRIAVACTDSGPGVAPEIAGRIGREPVSTKPGRAGAGLDVARRIALLHGGAIEHSRPLDGRGACFRILLRPARPSL